MVAHRRVGQGPKVMFVHGWLTAGDLWRRVLDLLTPGDQAPFEAIVPDLRGSASSAGTGAAELEIHANDLWKLLDRLLDEPGGETSEPIDLVGHSMGGAIATLMATQRPDRVRRLVLVCPVPPGGFALPDDVFAQFDAVGGDPDALRGFLAPQVPAAALDDLVRLCARTDVTSARNTLRAWTGASFADAARTLPHRPLVIAGARDPFLGPDVLRQTVVEVIPRTRLSEVEGGHYPMLDATEQLAERISLELLSPDLEDTTDS